MQRMKEDKINSKENVLSNGLKMSALALLEVLLSLLDNSKNDPTRYKAKQQCSVEICVDAIKSARNASIAGADRVELCSSLISGGLTPSIGTIIQVLRSVPNIEVHVMIRPRCGDFLYDEGELATIFSDIEAIVELKQSNQYSNLKGIVSGFLDCDGNINTDHLEMCMQRIKNCDLEFTFHRAIDMSNDAINALKDCIKCGVHRVLTSGMAINVELGMSCILKMIEYCKENQIEDDITIAVGGGITAENIGKIVSPSNAIRHVHGTFRKRIEGGMVHKRDNMFMGAMTVNGARLSEYDHKVAHTETVRSIVDHVRSIASKRI